MVSALDSRASGPGSSPGREHCVVFLPPIQGGVQILLVASCYRNRDKLRPGGPRLARMQILPMMLIVIFREFATA